ncbi:PQQ-binding-like beta-propeller repeat protein [Kitasatospora sp. NPDC051853]|uniref:outer membrane protein assembly factor BamB family protein n=1 Tax=Kitasatospora sp. NPDC051853 TaxID=3364058 RepID=UPI0037952FBE
MGERVRAPRRAGGRFFAAAAALAGVLLGGLAVPAHAEGPAAPTAGVLNDLTGDGRADVFSADRSGLAVLPAGGAPYVASTAAQSPNGSEWRTFQVSSRGSATGGRTEDLYVFDKASHELYLYPNDGSSGGRPGYFTKTEQVRKVAKPQSCAAGSDCTGYDPTWTSATQVLATDGIANQDGVPDLVTVEKGRLWYYPGKAGSVIGAPVQLGTGDWTTTVLLTPGKVGGVPTLWARSTTGVGNEMYGYRLEFGPDGLPVQPLRSPVTVFRLKSAVPAADGSEQCYTLPGNRLAPCGKVVAGWQLRADGTFRDRGYCLDAAPGPQSVGGFCSVSATQQWRVGPGAALVANDGRCLAAPAEGIVPVLEPCDGSPRQGWGRWEQGAAVPAALPAPFDVVVIPLAGFDDVHQYVGSLRSPGDLDGDGNPEMVIGTVNPYESSVVTVVRPGAAPVGGSARFGEPYSLGILENPRNSMTWNTPIGRSDVFYSACASLKVRGDGNLVLTELATGRELWSTRLPAHPAGRLVVQYGELALVDAGQSYWSSNPEQRGERYAEVKLSVQDDCNVVLRDPSGVELWSTRTYSPEHDTSGVPLMAGRTLGSGEQVVADRTQLAMQADGNLVLSDRQTSRVLWTSGTEGHPGATAAVQADGNLVVRDQAGAPVWSVGYWAFAGSRYVVQRDGNLVMYDPDSKPLWATHTWYGGVDDLGATLPSGRTLRSGETVESKAGRLVMQPDGNLVLYSKATGNSRWHSGTWGNEGATVTMQGDGNLVVRAVDGRALWSTGSWDFRNARLVVQDDLNLVLYAVSPGRRGEILARWASGTDNRAAARLGTAVFAGGGLRSGEVLNTPAVSPIHLNMQADGNLVLFFNAYGPVWDSRTWGNPGARFVVQDDGNAVIYAADGRALSSTGTWGHPGAYLVLQNDANLVLYDADGVVPLWSTGTYWQALQRR